MGPIDTGGMFRGLIVLAILIALFGVVVGLGIAKFMNIKDTKKDD